MPNWKRNLFIVWICQFLTMVGMSSVVPFLPLFVRELGVKNLEDTAFWSGLVFSGPFFVSFFLTSVWGSLGDKYGRKIMILRAVFGLAIAQTLIGFSQNVTQLFLGRLIQGALSGFLPAAMALIASNTPEEKTGYALGMLQSSTAAGNVLGPLIGGVLSDLFGFKFVFFSVAGLLFINGIFMIILIKEDVKVEKSSGYSILKNWDFLLRNKLLRLSAIMIMLTALAFSFVRPIFVLYIETFDLGKTNLPTITGALYSIVGIFSTFSAAWWGKQVEKTGVKRNLVYAAIITAAMYTVHSFIFSPFLLIPVRMLLGFGFGALLPLLFTSISRNVSITRRGGVLGVASSFQVLGNMIGPMAGGLAGGFLGLRVSFLITGLLFFIISFLALMNLKDLSLPAADQN